MLLPPLTRISQVLHAPLQDTYLVSGVILNSGKNIFEKIKTTMSGEELLAYLCQSSPILICQLQDHAEYGSYSYIDNEGKPFKFSRSSRAVGRYFLKQFFEDVALHSIEGMGSFEVVPIPSKEEGKDHVTSGWISSYFSRANEIVKEHSNLKLQAIGLSNKGRRDSIEDENGNSLPVYTYELKCSLLMIRPG